MKHRTTPTGHGGFRPGAGSKRRLENAEAWNDYLDAETVEIMTTFGKGNRSEGIRDAAQVIKTIGLKQAAQILQGKETTTDEKDTKAKSRRTKKTGR